MPETLFNEWTVSGIVVVYLCIMWWVMWSMLYWLCLFVQGCAQLLLSTSIFTYFFSLLILYFLLFHISKTTLLYLDDGFEEVCCFNVIFSLYLMVISDMSWSRQWTEDNLWPFLFYFLFAVSGETYSFVWPIDIGKTVNSLRAFHTPWVHTFLCL